MSSALNPSRLALFSLLMVVLAGVFALAVFNEIGSLYIETQRNFDTYRLANVLRQSSEDLTSMARLNVVTGEQRYRDYFDEILAIRNGEAAYPEYIMSRPYWDIVLATGERPGGFSEATDLQGLVEQIGVWDEAAALLYESEDMSNALVTMENEAMDVVAAYVAAGGDYGVVEGDVLAAIQRLHSQEYHLAKEGIMTPLVGIAELADETLRASADAAIARFNGLALGLGISLLLGILSALVSAVLARRKSA